MALYTGVNAIKKVKGVDSEVLIKVPFYSDFVRDIEFYESKGGYPSLDFILDYLYVEEEVEDTDENYYKFHERYESEIKRKEYYINEIDKGDLINKFIDKELSFITRRYDLAEYLQKELNSPEFYFHMIVPPNKLEQTLESCKEIVGIDFKNVLKNIYEMKDEYEFEVHVS